MSKTERHDEIQGAIIHEYDGILEADNELPRWWVFVFAATTIFALGYWYYYEVFEIGMSPAAAYADEMARDAAKSGKAVTGDVLLAFAADPAVKERGAAAFKTTCVACHAEHAEGKIGPNLTDKFWINGGAPEQIYKTIMEGVPAKGMPAWGPSLGAASVQSVAAYVISLRNTNVAGKEPQGDEYRGP